MEPSVSAWLVVVANALAAIAFLAMGRRLHSRALVAVGLAYVAAALLIGAAPLHQSVALTASGYLIGFVATLLGLRSLIKAYEARQGVRKRM
ncbi:MAG: hypothetical protein ACTS5I_08315 [Rhodanobacter sp.]